MLSVKAMNRLRIHSSSISRRLSTEIRIRLAEPNSEQNFLSLLAERAGKRKHCSYNVLDEIDLFRQKTNQTPSKSLYEASLHLFAETRNVSSAERLWERMGSDNVSPTSKMFNCMIRCYSRAGRLMEARKLFEKMKGVGSVKEDGYTYGSLITGEGVAGTIEGVFKLLEEAKLKIDPFPNTLYRVALGACLQQKNGQAAIDLLEMMGKNEIKAGVEDFYIAFKAQTSMEKLELLTEKLSSESIPFDQKLFQICIKKAPEIQSDSKPWDECLRMFEKIQKEEGIVPDENTWMTLINCANELAVEVGEINKLVLKMKRSGHTPPRPLLMRARARPDYTPKKKPDFQQSPPRRPWVPPQDTSFDSGLWRPNEDFSQPADFKLPDSVLSRFMKVEDDGQSDGDGKEGKKVGK